jgi:pimeloyl-ACP methyl ester carboxylesterase
MYSASWYDYSRDIIHMINTFRMPRPLVAVGHSFGANALSYAALLHPRLFHSMVLLDPVIAPYHKSRLDFRASPAAASVRRRDVWPSREAAAALFRKSPFYQAWDPRALDQWIKYGLHNTTPDPNGEVVLATTKHQEVFTFLRPSWPAFDVEGKHAVDPKMVPECGTSIKVQLPLYPFYRPEAVNTFMHMPNLRPGVVFILGGQSSVIGDDDARRRTEITGTGLGGSGGVASGRVLEVVHDKYGHFIPLEVPGFCSQHAADFLKGELDIWMAEAREYQEWAKTDNVAKVTVSREYKKHLGITDKPRAKM